MYIHEILFNAPYAAYFKKCFKMLDISRNAVCKQSTNSFPLRSFS